MYMYVHAYMLICTCIYNIFIHIYIYICIYIYIYLFISPIATSHQTPCLFTPFPEDKWCGVGLPPAVSSMASHRALRLPTECCCSWLLFQAPCFLSRGIVPSRGWQASTYTYTFGIFMESLGSKDTNFFLRISAF